MKTWTAQIDIDAPIEKVWGVIDGSEENLKKLDPKIVSNVPIEETQERIGSKYRRTYQDEKRVMEYVVEVTDYAESDTSKMLKTEFQLGKWFYVTVQYNLEKIDENQTHLVYETTNKPLKLLSKLLMNMAGNNDTVVIEHIKMIKSLSEM